MKKYLNFSIVILLNVILICCTFKNDAFSDNIREPAWSGRFYPSTLSELNQTISRLSNKAKSTQVQIPSDKNLKAIILPHAGYIYSGYTASHASLVLKQNQFSKVILLGPDHRIGFSNGAISDVDAYQTPFGAVKLHDDAKKLLENSTLFRANPGSDKSEHSLEVLLPFLQYYLKTFTFIPIVMGHRCDIEQFISAIDPLIDSNTLLVASSDLSHYLPYEEAVSRDKDTIKMILNLDARNLSAKENAACGKMPVLFIINMAKHYGWEPILLHYSNSGDTAGGPDRVVGYAAIAFYGGLSMKQLTHLQGQTLIKLARQTIEQKLGHKSHDSNAPATSLEDPVFQSNCGTFVTLKINDQLRGCIGNLTSADSILAGVKQNAISAAFHDYRFRPLTTDEIDKVEIEVSILTEPQPLSYRDSDDLLSKLRPNIDGVIIKKGGASATFLPQVWEQLADPKDFLSHLCSKAGMSSTAWKKPGLEVRTYQVQYFEEE